MGKNNFWFKFWQVSRKKRDLFVSWEERRYMIILKRIRHAKSIMEVESETTNIIGLSEDKLLGRKRKKDLFKVQNDRLNSFLNEEQQKVFKLAVQKRNIFFTGSAGTGKSFLLQRIIRSLELLNGRESVAITATTGVAAVNIGGVTLHSFCGIGYADELTPEELTNKILKQGSKKWLNNWRAITTLIIDEISMLDGKLFDKLECIARRVRSNNLPFGGLQLILTGDFFQLPPVKSNKFCFEANCWKVCLHNAIQLTKIYRQREPELINLLNEIRFGKLSSGSWKILKSLEKDPIFPDDGIKATQLMATNSEVNGVNSTELSRINSQALFYKAVDWEDKRYGGRLKELAKNCLAAEILELRVGAQVMLIKNLTENLVNGCQGVIIGFRWTTNQKLVVEEKRLPVVRFTNGIERTIQEEEWTDETPIYRIVRARRTQIPLILSWAITIHKSQGQSIERLKINLNRVFERGQTYVALSRACSIKYLQVIGFNPNKVYCDEKVKKFYRELSAI